MVRSWTAGGDLVSSSGLDLSEMAVRMEKSKGKMWGSDYLGQQWSMGSSSAASSS